MKKELAKIKSVIYGYGGYQECQFGWWFSFSMKDRGIVSTGKGFWTSEPTDSSQWNKDDQIKMHGETTMELINIMKQAKVKEVHDLVGCPVELTMDCLKLNSWRILEEVL